MDGGTPTPRCCDNNRAKPAPATCPEGHPTAQSASVTKLQRQKWSRKSRRRPDGGCLLPLQQLPASSPSERYILPRNLMDSLIKLTKSIDDAIELVERLEAVDFSADYTIGSVPVRRATPVTPSAVQSKSTAEPSSASGTPSRQAVEKARAAFQKLNSAIPVTEAARLTTHMANLKVSNTPPQQRQPAQQRTPSAGNMTSRELRYQPSMSPVQPLSRYHNGPSAADASLGSMTARGPRAAPYHPVAASPAIDRTTPLRPPLTARPSRTPAPPALDLVSCTPAGDASPRRDRGNAPVAPRVTPIGARLKLDLPLQERTDAPASRGSGGGAGAGAGTGPVPPTPSLAPLGSPFSPTGQSASPAAFRQQPEAAGCGGQMRSPRLGAAATGVTLPCKQQPQQGAEKGATPPVPALRLPVGEANRGRSEGGRREGWKL